MFAVTRCTLLLRRPGVAARGAFSATRAMSAKAAASYHVNDGVATITLNRPKQKNALSVDLVNAVGDHLATAQADDSVRVVLLTNAGNTFCAGADLKDMSTVVPVVLQRLKLSPLLRLLYLFGVISEPKYQLTELLAAIIDCPKPVVGRIAGHCTGGGVGLAAALDVSVVADDALFGFTEVRLGVSPAMISVVCLPKLRRADASELFLSGERISATRAAEVGLVNYAVPAAELDANVDDVVGKLARGGPNALTATKGLVAKVPQMKSREEAFDWTAPLSLKLFKSDEAKEGIAAFRERRDARWVPEGRRSDTGRA
jgi:methylglutaconyl-CoA hydratase